MASKGGQETPPPGPRIPTDIVDPPTQRLYVASLFTLLQAYKLSEALWPANRPPVGLDGELDLNTRLLRWLVIDLLAVAVIAWLRVPRLNWGWKARWGVRAVLMGSDWVLFGRWTFAASFFLPAFLKSFLVRSLSTTERSVRLASVYGKESSHLGGQFTVHILAVSTAFLNPLSTVYCRHPSSSKTHSEPTLIPLILNNTTPASLSYTITTFDDAPTSKQHTIPASSLVRHPHGHHRLRNNQGRRAISNAEDDDLALASEWALVPASSSISKSNPQQALRHRLPDSSLSSQNGASDPSDPFNLSPTESLYYLPVTQLGSVRLDSIVDTEGHAIRIKRKRAPSTPSSAASSPSFDETRVLRCPTAGLALDVPGATGEREEHRCLSPSSPIAQAFPLGLTVSGQAQPLKVRWHSREGDPLHGVKKDEALEGIVGLGGEGYGKEEVIPVPMNVTLSRAGRTTFYLDSVTDGAGNEVTYSGLSSTSSSSSSGSSDKHAGSTGAPLIPNTVPSRSVIVHRPPEAAFVGECAKGEEVSLLVGGRKKLIVKLTGVEQGEGTEVTIRYTPPEEGQGAGKKAWEKNVEARGAKAEIEVREPGVYEIVGVRSQWCGGVVLVPNACTLVLQPVPTLTPTFTPLTDVCSSEIGLLSTLHLTGAPPFTVHYAITRLASPSSNRPQTKAYTKRINHSREELRLEAPGPGEWEYRFQKVSDRYYGEVVLKGREYAMRQKVYERGDAKWKDVERGRTVHSCEGETVQVEVELSGNAPWDVEYSVVGQKTVTLSQIPSSPHAFSVTIPPHIAKQGGQFALSLESVRDGNGCKRPLAVADLQVDVKRTKPTARFHGKEGERSVVLREGETAKIPLRLTGEAPWTVTYQPPSRDGRDLSPISFSAQQANVDINIRNALPGTYKLLSVRDHYCPGDVFEPSWSVSTLPRPTLRFGDNIGKVARNGSVIRTGVCANVADSFPVVFSGKAPFKASYTLTKGSHHSGEKREHILQAIQPKADLTLFTAEPGHHSYHFTGVGDSLYTSPDAAGLVAPKSGASGSGKNGALLRVEQDVFALPTAYFAHGPKHGFCVNDELASRSADDLILHLTGSAPFEVELEVREEGHRSSSRKFTVPAIQEHKWPVQLPFGLAKASPHSVSIRRVKDAHGCESVIDASSASSGALAAVNGAGASLTSLTIPVAEIATIKPVSPQIDHCVGDFLDFTVQGQPPFTVVYEFEGKRHSVPLNGGKFQRVAAKEGEFRIVSVGHGEDQCRSKEVNIVKHIHPLPSARVQTGESYVVDLREGEQTEIIFFFTGTAPFSFTYSRRAPQDRSKDRTVLETHTVTGIQEHSYSIFTSQEGTWSVSYVADAYCAYPPSQKAAPVKA